MRCARFVIAGLLVSIAFGVAMALAFSDQLAILRGRIAARLRARRFRDKVRQMRDLANKRRDELGKKRADDER